MLRDVVGDGKVIYAEDDSYLVDWIWIGLTETDFDFDLTWSIRTEITRLFSVFFYEYVL